MDPKGFLDLPDTVREQIYTKLLVSPAIEITGDIPAGTIHCSDTHRCIHTSILYTNRRIFNESSNILYAKNLFIIFNFNNHESPELASKITETFRRIPFRGIEETRKIVSRGRFSMVVNLFSVGRRLDTSGSGQPSCVITPEDLPLLLNCLTEESVGGNDKPMAVVRFDVLNTFRYSSLRFAELVFGPLLEGWRVPLHVLKALSVEGRIDPGYQ
ncbi:hypothetical protein BU23DRAFT_281537 [Bimuria novae-zelandiae CBS 107.79]|uniref:F-box domain-containing protein n=1 Tax=Bimuria novae-zelandiae CBS 107.79 TaxID=1447943 RepID=A0A6A5UV58_9PLEO|nr:hypothetical protein BU23DRAFT_281537 [Bimuria novae-zelandiae CBS 107.79]